MSRISRLIVLILCLSGFFGGGIIVYAQDTTSDSPITVCDPAVDYAAQAVTAYDAGDYNASLPTFFCALGADPLNTDLRVMYVQAALQMGNIYSVFRSSAFLDTLAPERYDDVAVAAEAALAADPTDEAAAVILAFAHYPIIQEDLDRILAINPESAIAYAYVASKAIYQDQDPDAAIAAITHAIELAPNDVEILGYAESIYSNMGDQDRVIDLLERILEIDPNFAPAYADRATHNVTLGNPEAALDDLNRAVELDPYDYRTINLRAILLQENEDYAGALADYTYVLSVNPGSWTALRGIIEIGLETDDADSRTLAAQAFQTARTNVEDGETLTVDAPLTVTITGGQMLRLPLALAEGESVTITAIAADPESLDPMLMVVDPNGAAVAWNDDISDVNWGASVTVTAETAGEYLVLATHSGGGTEGDMTVNASTSN